MGILRKEANQQRGVSGVGLSLRLGMLGVLIFARCGLGQERVRVNVDAGVRHQTIRGFGASGAWWPNWVGDFSQEKRARLLDLLFGEQGIGLSIYRYNIPVGGDGKISNRDRATASVENGAGRYDLSADGKALEILREVRERGVERFVLFANSPPGRLTRNGLTSGGDGGESNLKEGAEGAYAEYLVDLGTMIREKYALPEVALSPINEPQWKWGEKNRTQEGCYYTAKETATVLRAVIEAVERRKAGMRVEGPESGSWELTSNYAEAMFADPVIDGRIDELAIHSYWSSRKQKQKAATELAEKFPGKRLAMSEYCEMKGGTNLSIESGMRLADVIEDDLTIGNAVSWSWWLGVGPGGFNDGLVYAGRDGGDVRTSKRLWVLGQWSRFVRPGFVRVEATASDERIRVSGFLSGDGKRLVCVLINPGEKAIAAEVNGFQVKAMTVYVTDGQRDLEKAEMERGNLVLAAKSVTTLVLEK
jgi:O-glycosyl hydrolase